MHLAPFKLRQYGRNGCSHLTAEIERAVAFWLHVVRRGPFRAVLQHSGTPFVITMSDGEGTGSVAAAIWSPSAPGGVHQPRWFQLDLPPAAFLPWSDGKELEPQRHINKIEAIVPAICLCTWSYLIRGFLWPHFIDNDGVLACLVSGCSKAGLYALLWTSLGRKSLYLDVGRGSKGCHQSATSWMDCLGQISPLRSRMIGCEAWRSCLSLC